MLNKRFALALVTVVFLSAASNAQTLLGNFTWASNGHTYELYGTDGISYTDAGTYAVSRGGYLATIVDQAETDAITSNLGSLVPDTAYLGAAQPIDETDVNGGWTWVTGEAWSYTNWSGGEPNDFTGPASEQFLELYGTGFWNDIGENSSGYNKGFLVEIVPEPVTLIGASIGVITTLLRRRHKH